ncbi:MAG: class I SAM-dependent methyltransferase [Chloroflexi bacterium]|nr:class I SAM-dependent methyltransferase [Chloroflexota bacterium]
MEAAISLLDRSPVLRRTINRIFYQYLAFLDKQGEVHLMNYGYADGSPLMRLESADEPDRLCLQLYHRVASATDLHGKDVLEVGSGRGGGASYVHRYLGPKRTTGVDYAQRSVVFCQRTHRVPGLVFHHGDAEDLPFGASQFDAVLNVESSHCYGSMARFLDEVVRVLKPGGHFLWADFRPAGEVAALLETVTDSGLAIKEQETITDNILAALDGLSARNRALIDRAVPRPLRPLFYRFAAVDGTTLRDRFTSGELTYLRIAAVTPAG